MKMFKHYEMNLASLDFYSYYVLDTIIKVNTNKLVEWTTPTLAGLEVALFAFQMLIM